MRLPPNDVESVADDVRGDDEPLDARLARDFLRDVGQLPALQLLAVRGEEDGLRRLRSETDIKPALQ